MNPQFTTIGQSHTANDQERWLSDFQSIEWQTVPCPMPMSQGLGIKGLVSEFRLPTPNAVGWICAPEEGVILAVECIAKSGQQFRVYAFDDGVSVTPVAFHELVAGKEAA